MRSVRTRISRCGSILQCRFAQFPCDVIESSAMNSRRQLTNVRKWATQGQRWLSLSFALFFAFVMPFICWGAAGTPGHPHAHAHFIFALPPDDSAESSTQPHLHIPRLVDGQWVVDDSHSHHHGDVPPGRSEPDLSLITLLLLLLGGSATIAYILLVFFPRELQYHMPQSVIHSPPVPPPKRLPLSGCVCRNRNLLIPHLRGTA